MAFKNIVQPLVLKTIDASTLTTSYKPINPSGVAQPCSIIKITNTSDRPIYISYNGIDDHDIILAGTTQVFDFQSNAQPSVFVANLPRHTIVYAKGSGGSGIIAISGWYQEPSSI